LSALILIIHILKNTTLTLALSLRERGLNTPSPEGDDCKDAGVRATQEQLPRVGERVITSQKTP
jgi:hypothetical protein